MMFNKFISRLIIFLTPVFLMAILVEIFIVFYPNTFNLKASYIKNNNDIELLVLGSSHNQTALNPEFLDLKTANLAYGGQDLSLDSKLFFKYIDELKKLKYVLLEMDYHTLEAKRPKNYFRHPWYYRYHGVNGHSVSLINKLSLYSSSPEFFKKYILRHISPNEPKVIINEHGFVTSSNHGLFEEMRFSEKEIIKTAENRLKNRHKKIVLNNYYQNKILLNNIIKHCEEHNIKVILISTPLYKTYLKNKVVEKDVRRKNYIDSLLYFNKKINYLDFETDSKFLLTDFKDDDHLNSKGAKKLTQILKSKFKDLGFD